MRNITSPRSDEPGSAAAWPTASTTPSASASPRPSQPRLHAAREGVPEPHSPVPDLSIDLTAPARAYDNLGQRLFFGTGQTVDCSTDLSGISTDVSTAANERWLSIFGRLKGLLSDPRTDGKSQQVVLRRDEFFELVVRQEPEGPAGAAPRLPLQPDELLCDVRRRPGQTQVTRPRSPASCVATVPGKKGVWVAGDSGGADLGGSVRAGEVVDQLIHRRLDGGGGDEAVRREVDRGGWVAVRRAGEVGSQLRVDLIERGLARRRGRVEGRPCAGGDSDRAALYEDEGLAAGGVEVERQHLWDAQGTGVGVARFRVYLDGDSVWLVMNASWNGAQWSRNAPGNAAALRLGWNTFELTHENTTLPQLTAWTRTWRLPLDDSGVCSNAVPVANSRASTPNSTRTWAETETAPRISPRGRR